MRKQNKPLLPTATVTGANSRRLTLDSQVWNVSQMKLSAEGKCGEKSRWTWKEQQASDDLCRVRKKARSRVSCPQAGLQMSQLCCNTCPGDGSTMWDSRQGPTELSPFRNRDTTPTRTRNDRQQRNSTFSAVSRSQNDAIPLTLDDCSECLTTRVCCHGISWNETVCNFFNYYWRGACAMVGKS